MTAGDGCTAEVLVASCDMCTQGSISNALGGPGDGRKRPEVVMIAVQLQPQDDERSYSLHHIIRVVASLYW